MNIENLTPKQEAEALWNKGSDEMRAEIARLRAELEAARVDAERYRWLRDPCSGAERVVMYGRGDYGRGLMAYTMLDEAIDAAIDAARGGK